LLPERFGSGDGERKTLLTRQIDFEPLPASVLFGFGVGGALHIHRSVWRKYRKASKPKNKTNFQPPRQNHFVNIRNVSLMNTSHGPSVFGAGDTVGGGVASSSDDLRCTGVDSDVRESGNS
jgi:hypothetical protein